MNFFGWKRQSRKWLTVAVTAVLSLTLLPAQGRTETFWQMIITLSKPQKPQCQCGAERACCPETPCCPQGGCPQGVCTGACTMPCCPGTCPNHEQQAEKLCHVAKIFAMLGHTEAANYFYYLAKKATALAEAQCECAARPVNKPHRCAGGCGEECCNPTEPRTEGMRHVCTEHERTIQELREVLSDLTSEIKALREEMQVIRKSQGLHVTQPCTIQLQHWVPPPMPSSNLPPHSLAPHIDSNYHTGPMIYSPVQPTFMPHYQMFNVPVPALTIPRVQSGLDFGFELAPAAQQAERVFEFHTGLFR